MSNTIDGSTVQIDGVRFREAAGDPSTPAASHWLLYTKAAGLFIIDDAGNVTGPFGTGGGSGTSIVIPLTNKSGGTVNLGDVVYLDDSNTEAFQISCTTFFDTYVFGVVVDASIANNAVGNICLGGYVAQINLDASASIGDHISNSGSCGQGSPRAAYSFGGGFPWDTGQFAVALSAGTTPSAYLFAGPPIAMGERLLVLDASVNMNTATAVTLYTVPAGRTCVITKLVYRAPSTSLTTVSWSVGFNSTPFDNVLANATHTELTGSGLYTVLVPKIGAALGAAAGVLKHKNNTLQGGAATAQCDVYGYLY
jgi:hypothetical protein